MLLTYKNIICALVLGIAVMQVNTMQFQDEQKEFNIYCENVEKNIWPDYNYQYEAKCKNRP